MWAVELSIIVLTHSIQPEYWKVLNSWSILQNRAKGLCGPACEHMTSMWKESSFDLHMKRKLSWPVLEKEDHLTRAWKERLFHLCIKRKITWHTHEKKDYRSQQLLSSDRNPGNVITYQTGILEERNKKQCHSIVPRLCLPANWYCQILATNSPW